LGGSLGAGERVLLEEDYALSRHGTERLQIYSHSFASFSVLVVESELSGRKELGADLWREQGWEKDWW
jgi:hypothetical protein